RSLASVSLSACSLTIVCCSSFFPLSSFFFLLLIPPPPISTLFPYTTLFRSGCSPAVPASSSNSPRGWAPCSAKSPKWHQLPQRRSEEHTSELQSRFDLVCRLLLEKKKKNKIIDMEYRSKR